MAYDAISPDRSRPGGVRKPEEAQAYTQWLSRKTKHSYRLLSEAEWNMSRAPARLHRHSGVTPEARLRVWQRGRSHARG